MDFATYAPLARRTMKELPWLRRHIIHMVLGIIGEYGELVDALKKAAIYGKQLDAVNLTEEVGDVSWYVFGLCPELGVDPAEMEAPFMEGYSAVIADPPHDLFEQAESLIWMSATAAYCCEEFLQDEATKEGAKLNLLSLAALLGSLCATLHVDISEALDKNIAKLAARYGDKYSDYSALNRELGTERAVLEGGTSVGLSGATVGTDTGTLAS